MILAIYVLVYYRYSYGYLAGSYTIPTSVAEEEEEEKVNTIADTVSCISLQYLCSLFSSFSLSLFLAPYRRA